MRKAIFDGNMLFFGTLSLNKPKEGAEEETKTWFPFFGNIICFLSQHIKL